MAFPISVPALASQRRIVPSSLPEASMGRPSGPVHAVSALTQSVWPVMAFPIGVPVLASQRRIVPSLSPAAITARPLGAV
jgi:hypothetical protein